MGHLEQIPPPSSCGGASPRGPSRAGIPYNSFGIPRNPTRNLESGILGLIKVRLFQETSGYFNSARLRSVYGPRLACSARVVLSTYNFERYGLS